EVSTCTVTFDYNTTVRITAHPRADWRFTGFTGDVDRTKLSTNPIVVTMNGDKTITATFVPLASAIPVSNWAILVGIGLMITFLVIRFRRMV
ncbi:MAG: hypothetical protein Q8M23_06420, partial [Bacteroidales bacterium]|nr:hypothetical protein [Bacteroidales bacterium]